MRTIEVSVYASVRPTELMEKVLYAIENIFPGLSVELKGDRIVACGGESSLRTFHRLLREQRILDTARSVMLRGQVGGTVQFRINKQAAFMCRINFPFEEEPLGSIHIQIAGDDKLIDWMAPRTENGVPIKEIDILEGDV